MRTARTAGTVQSGEENAQSDLSHVHKQLMGGNEYRARLLAVVPRNKMRQ